MYNVYVLSKKQYATLFISLHLFSTYVISWGQIIYKELRRLCWYCSCGITLSQNVLPIRLILAQCESIVLYYRQVMMDLGIQNCVSGFPKSPAEKWVEGKLNYAFLHFLQIFTIFVDISIMKTSLVQLAKSASLIYGL